MTRWINRVVDALRPESDSEREVRAVLQQAVNRRLPLELIVTTRDGSDPPYVTTIIRVRKDDFVIAVPHGGPIGTTLYDGQVFTMALSAGRGRHVGTTRVLGRHKSTDGGRPFIGYAMAIPAALDLRERREFHRISVGFDIAPAATLHVTNSDLGPIEGIIQDLSMGGALIRCAARYPRLAPGMQVCARLSFPDPIGQVLELAEIAHVSPAKQSEQMLVGLRFARPNEKLGTLLRTFDLRRATRRHSA
ncbi:MAG: PilZ domain-containing protein [Phycisphaerales bacterium]|nr:PilZ domain-containing protein [Phycisphaerales bacterium]